MAIVYQRAERRSSAPDQRHALICSQVKVRTSLETSPYLCDGTTASRGLLETWPQRTASGLSPSAALPRRARV